MPDFVPLTTIEEVDQLRLETIIRAKRPEDFPPQFLERFVEFVRRKFSDYPNLIEQTRDGFDEPLPYEDGAGVSAENICHPFTTEALDSCESYGEYEIELFTHRGRPYLTMISTCASNNASYVFDTRGELRFEFSDLCGAGCPLSNGIVRLSREGAQGESIADLKASGALQREGSTDNLSMFGDTYTGGEFSMRMHGEGHWRSREGESYVGHYRHGRRHGHGTHETADGTVVTGYWHEGEFVGDSPRPEPAAKKAPATPQAAHYEGKKAKPKKLSKKAKAAQKVRKERKKRKRRKAKRR